MDKKALRQQLLLKVASMSDAQRQEQSARILDKLLNVQQVQEAQSVFVFLSTQLEPDTWEFVNIMLKNKLVFVPVIEQKKMLMAQVFSHTKYVKNKWGIMQPECENLTLQAASVAVVPAVGLTVEGRRLGRGGGFYDRYLAMFDNVYKIGIAFECQVVQNLPMQEHDICMDKIIF